MIALQHLFTFLRRTVNASELECADELSSSENTNSDSVGMDDLRLHLLLEGVIYRLPLHSKVLYLH